MDGLRGFLERFAHLQPTEPIVKKAVCAACADVFGYTPKEELVHYQGTTAFLEVSNTIKKAILEKKVELLESVKNKLPPHITITDIR